MATNKNGSRGRWPTCPFPALQDPPRPSPGDASQALCGHDGFVRGLLKFTYPMRRAILEDIAHRNYASVGECDFQPRRVRPSRFDVRTAQPAMFRSFCDISDVLKRGTLAALLGAILLPILG